MISARTGEPKQQDPPLSYAPVEMTLLKTIWGSQNNPAFASIPLRSNSSP
jgi:hypothetical protein